MYKVNLQTHTQLGWEGRDWTSLRQDRDKWQAVVKTVMNLQVPYNMECFSTS